MAALQNVEANPAGCLVVLTTDSSHFHAPACKHGFCWVKNLIIRRNSGWCFNLKIGKTFFQGGTFERNMLFVFSEYRLGHSKTACLKEPTPIRTQRLASDNDSGWLMNEMHFPKETALQLELCFIHDTLTSHFQGLEEFLIDTWPGLILPRNARLTAVLLWLRVDSPNHKTHEERSTFGKSMVFEMAQMAKTKMRAFLRRISHHSYAWLCHAGIKLKPLGGLNPQQIPMTPWRLFTQIAVLPGVWL